MSSEPVLNVSAMAAG